MQGREGYEQDIKQILNRIPQDILVSLLAMGPTADLAWPCL